jgi:hypothetical protein
MIREYDMSEAGFSLIKEYSLLPDKSIHYLEDNFDKPSRTKEIGKIMLKDKKLSKRLMDAFIKIRGLFFEANNIQDSNVLSIKKDAIFVIDKVCDVLEFGDNIVFKPKNRYSSYLYLNKCEFYYSVFNKRLDVKGLGNIMDNPLLLDIEKIMRCNETMNKNQIYKLLQELRNDYLNLDLEIETYREMNKENKFKLKQNMMEYNFYIDSIDEDFLDKIDITYNYIHYILPLINILI